MDDPIPPAFDHPRAFAWAPVGTDWPWLASDDIFRCRGHRSHPSEVAEADYICNPCIPSLDSETRCNACRAAAQIRYAVAALATDCNPRASISNSRILYF